jgi:undecaprenyl-diphosphatase
MNLFQALVLGILQGISELIPISSSGNLVILPFLTGWEKQPLSFDIMIHAGTLLALIIYFRTLLSNLVIKFKDKNNLRLTKNLIITTLPAIIIGYFLSEKVKELSSFIPLISIMLITIGLIFIFIENKAMEQTKKISEVNLKDALKIGVFQVLAFIRGTSRSGITLIGGIYSGLNVSESLKYSFLAGIMIISSTVFYQIFDFYKSGVQNISIISLIIGFSASFITSLVIIKYIFGFIKKKGLIMFGILRILLGISILIIYINKQC